MFKYYIWIDISEYSSTGNAVAGTVSQGSRDALRNETVQQSRMLC